MFISVRDTVCCVLPLGIGPKRAVNLIQKYKSIEEIMKHKSTLPGVSGAYVHAYVCTLHIQGFVQMRTHSALHIQVIAIICTYVCTYKYLLFSLSPTHVRTYCTTVVVCIVQWIVMLSEGNGTLFTVCVC